MLGLPPWALTLIITFLQKVGAVSWAESLIAKGIVAAQNHIENLRTYQQYPAGRNGR